MGKTFFITDITSNITQNIALQAAEEGHQIIYNSYHLENENEFVQLLKKVDATFHSISYNPSESESIQNAIEIVKRKVEKIDVVVSNLDIKSPLSFEEFDGAKIKKYFDDAILPHYLYYRIFIPLFLEQNEGDFVQLFHLPFDDDKLKFSIYYSFMKAIEGFLDSFELKYFQFNLRLIKIYYQKVEQDKFFLDGDTISANDFKPEDVAQVVLNAITLHKRSVISELYLKTSRRHL